MKIIDKIAFIDLKNGQILSSRSKGKSVYYIPGGKREPGESDVESLVREVKEELDVQIVPESAKYLGTFSAQADGHPKGVIVQMTCYEAEYNGVLKASSEIAEIKWLNYSDMDIIAAVDKVIFNHLKEAGRLE